MAEVVELPRSDGWRDAGTRAGMRGSKAGNRPVRRERTPDTFEAMEARRAGRIIVDDVDGLFNDEDEAECSDY